MTLIELEIVDSTNEECFRRRESGLQPPFFITAKGQQAGRGRSGRSWVSPEGNLYLSACVQAPKNSEVLSQIGFVTGVALIDALISTTQKNIFKLKWPNDILIDGKKLAGVLLEMRQIEQDHIIVIGMGINILSAPAGLPYPTICLNEVCDGTSLTQLRQEIIKALHTRLVEWSEGLGFSSIRTLWQQFAYRLHEEITINKGQEIVTGLFEGIDADGCLCLLTAQGQQRVIAGDVLPAER